MNNGYVPFKSGKAEFEYDSSDDKIKFGPVLYIIRNDKVYIKSVKAASTIYRSVKNYKIEICNLDYRIVPVL